MNQEIRTQSQCEEIDLIDYVGLIIKNKQLILIILFFAIIIAGLFTYLAPKVYKIDTYLEIGKIGENSILEIGIIKENYIETPCQLVEKIKVDAFGALIREKLKIPERKYPKIKAENPKDTGLVKIEIESAEPGLAKIILEEMNNLILLDHQEKINVKKEILRKDIERLKNKINFLEEEKNNLEEKIRALEKILFYQQNPETQFILFDIKEKFEKKKQEIEDFYLKINSLERRLEDIKPTIIIKNPSISEKPIKPKLVLNLIISVIFGIFIGIFFVLGKERWKK